MSMHRTKIQQAFTLVELLIVITIATILATLALTTMRGLLKDQKMSQAVRLARQYIETARTRAIANGRPVALFLERVSPEGDSAGAVVEANYTVTRMSIGEVFPPYTGESTAVTASLWDVALSSTRGNDQKADQARFPIASVVTGFGTATSPGMISLGDTIEFTDNKQRFVIEAIDFLAAEVAVTFFNPPEKYDGLLAAKIQSGTATDTTFEVGYSGREPTLPLPSASNSLANRTTATPSSTAVTPVTRGFRIYRKPSKSLVGAITMPRGTCIDLTVSGIGPTSSAIDTTSPFYLASAPSSTVSGTLARSSYSRIAIVFNPDGRAQGMYKDNRIVGSGGIATVGSYEPFSLSSKLHLMVGRTEQVIPGAPMSVPGTGDRGDVRGNLMDPGNTWISINPFTGMIESSPVAAVSGATTVAEAVTQSRRFSAMGVNDGGR